MYICRTYLFLYSLWRVSCQQNKDITVSAKQRINEEQLYASSTTTNLTSLVFLLLFRDSMGNQHSQQLSSLLAHGS